MENNFEMIDLRLVFCKKDRAKFISHLDLVRTMTRAIKRAKTPIWYTQGFNPHPYITFPLALSLGVESETEFMDIRLIEEADFDTIKENLNRQLPENLQFSAAFSPTMKHTQIEKSEYEIFIKTNKSADDLLLKWKEFLSLEKIEVEKRTKKKGISTVDLKPFIEAFGEEISQGGVKINLILPAGTTFNLNTSLVTDEFSKYIGEEFEKLSVKRTKILAKSGESFT